MIWPEPKYYDVSKFSVQFEYNKGYNACLKDCLAAHEKKCKCNPLGSGEEYCTGHCGVTQSLPSKKEIYKIIEKTYMGSPNEITVIAQAIFNRLNEK